ncbi:Cysteine alpha-hairpin motif superfamily [Corchorus olitorius]|uniref:Cysteine alpha-hairpin motif superfamily n=1 Tax=Corchorus olitorius TaxID=93759 RepID=A0A1R3IUD2_9ROSI|nr:Cysteine alpha-hairpin motif superfamily [Corchorus olitorius]
MEARGQAVCGQEALDLLNCVTQNPFDQDKCIRLLHSLRHCVLTKKVNKFSLDKQEHKDKDSVSKKN